MKSILHRLISSMSSPFHKSENATATENILGSAPELFEKKKHHSSLADKTHRFAINALGALVVFLFFGANLQAQTLLTWNTFGNVGTETTEPSTTNTNVAAANLTTGPGLSPAAANANRYGGQGWFTTGDTNPNTLAQALATNDYIQFIVTPNTGFSFTPTSFTFIWDFSSTGPKSVSLRSSVDGYATDLGSVLNMTASTSTVRTITITGLTNITTTTTFRLYGYNATGTGGTGGFDTAANANNIALNGTTASTGTPAIGTSGTLASVNTIYGTPSAVPTSFNVSGSNMSEGILVSPPNGYEVSLASGGTYTPTLTVGAAGTIASTPVFVRLSATATVAGSPYSGNIVLTSASASTVNVATVQSTVSTKTLTITGTIANSKIYDRTTTATITGAIISGSVNGDSLSFSGGGTFNNFNVGTAKPVTAALILNGTNASSYTFAQPSGLTADITAKDLTISGATANNKPYDGNTGATFSGTLSGVISPDDVSVSLVGSFDSPFVDVNIPVAAAASLSGASIGNYNLIQPTGLTANITKKALTVANATALNKIYDGTTDAVITGTLVGVIAPDTVDFIGTGTFASASVGTNIAVTSTATIEGDIDNYMLTQPTGLTANISEAELLPQAITFDPLASAVYGDANIPLTATSDSGLTVNYNSSDPSVATIVAGAAPGTYEIHIVSVGAGFTTITATQSGDSVYDSATPVAQALSVLPKELTADESAANKVYDRTDVAVVTGTLIGVVGSDDVSFIGAGNFASADAGTAISVFPASTLEGTAAANYYLTESVLTADITPKPLTVTGATASNKVYNGTTTATITGAVLTGVIAPDAVTVSGGGTFTSKDVATGIAVNAALTLNGAQAANYSVTQPTGLTANITPLALTISGLSGVDKIYDRGTTATLSGTAALVGVIAPDDVSLTGTVTSFFNNKTVANAKPISVFGYILTGAQLANYTVIQPTGLTANITPYAITIFNAAAVSKLYDGTTAATITGTLVGTLGSDVVTLNGTGTFASAAVGTNIAVTSTSTIGGTDGPNYIISPQPTGLTANIAAAPNYLGTQDFEAVPATPTLTFTTTDSGTVNGGSGFVTGATTVADAPSSANYFSGGSRGYQVYPTSNPASRVLTFSSVDASAYTNLQASFRIASLSVASTGNGMDNTLGTTILGANTPVDFALVEVSPDGGTTWYKQAVVSTSGSNTRWGFTGTGTGTRAYAANDTYSNYVVAGSATVTGTTAITTAVVTSLPASANLRIRITLQSNASSEHWVIDDVNISGIVGSACTTPDSVTSLAATNGSSSSVVSWNYGSCYDDAIIIASTSAFTSAVPTGDGSAYTVTSQNFTDAGNSVFDGGKVVYKGAANTATITSLTNGTTYNFKVFVRKGTTWTAGDVTSATPIEAQYFWDADGATTAATGGTGTWDNSATSNWRTPNVTGSLAPWNTNTTPLNATIGGTAGTITIPTTITTPVAPNLYINTTGYTFASTGTTAITIPAANTVLANNVQLTFSPNINTTTPVIGSFNMGSISAGSNAGITLLAAQGTSAAITQRINLSRNNSVIAAPITIASAGGTGTATIAALVATATGTSLSSAATIVNNTAIKTGLGATSGFDITVNGVISGSADLIFAAGSAGGAGTVTLNAANNYTGATLFNLSTTGIVKLGINNALPTATNVTMGYSSTNGGILDLNGFNQTLASLTNGAGGGSIRNNAVATDAVLTLNGSASNTFGLAINDGTSKVGLAKAGTGTMTLSSTSNSYTGGTTISGGVLQLGAAGVLANAGAIVLNGGTLSTGATLGFSETVGALNVNTNSVISLGTGNHNLSFASAGNIFTGDVNIANWSGVAGASGTAGKVFFGTTAGLTTAQLAKIHFAGYSGASVQLSTGEIVPSGPSLVVTAGSLDHGATCLNTAANFIDYTITNTGATAAGVTVTSNNPEFAVSNAPTAINAGSTATYRVTFTPTVAGARNAVITITTTTANSNGPILSSLTGTGNAIVTYYADLDDDTYGDVTKPVTSCTGAPNYLGHLATLNNTDCNDADTTVYQNANLYIDADSDGYDAGQEVVCYGASIPTGHALSTLGTDCNDAVFSSTNNCTSTGSAVNLKMFIEGYYVSEGTMNSVALNQDLDQMAPDTDVEMMTIELHDATDYSLIDTTTAMLHTDGTLSATFTTAAAGSYYIAVKGSNIVQTWSAVPQAVGTTTLNYDFTTSASQAYLDNQAAMFDGPFAMMSGDVNQDEIVDPSDFAQWEADFNAFSFGLFPTDLNGDGIVDPSDVSVWEASFNRFTFAAYPFLQ